LYEQCLLRPWPGNVRELLSAVEAAAARAKSAREASVGGGHLAATAGCETGCSATVLSTPVARPRSREEKEVAVLAAYRKTPDAAAVATRVGVGVATVYRYLKKHGVVRGEES
jgi:transcriptional regulator of acetoin/glycerol metabolism